MHVLGHAGRNGAGHTAPHGFTDHVYGLTKVFYGMFKGLLAG